MKFREIALLFFLALFYAGHGKPNFEIVEAEKRGGFEQVKKTETYDTMVAVALYWKHEKAKLQCAGVAVTKEEILTPARCVWNYDENKLYGSGSILAATLVSTGTTNIPPFGTVVTYEMTLHQELKKKSVDKFQIAAVRYNTNFEGERTSGGDLAVIKMADTRKFTGDQHIAYCSGSSDSYEKKSYSIKTIRERNKDYEHIKLKEVPCPTTGTVQSDKNVCFSNYCPIATDIGYPAYVVNSKDEFVCLFSILTWIDDEKCDSKGTVTHALISEYSKSSNFYTNHEDEFSAVCAEKDELVGICNPLIPTKCCPGLKCREHQNRDGDMDGYCMDE